jgi:hypothetical protein
MEAKAAPQSGGETGEDFFLRVDTADPGNPIEIDACPKWIFMNGRWIQVPC